MVDREVYQQCSARLVAGAVTYYCTQDSSHRGKHTHTHPDNAEEAADIAELPYEIRAQWRIEE